MRTIANINVLEDETFQGRILRLSLALFAGGLVVGLALLAAAGLGPGSYDGPKLLVLVLTFVLLPLPLHELVHGAAFKLFDSSARVRFGRKGAFLYATTDGVVLSRARMAVVLLAPSLIVTAAILVAGSAASAALFGAVAAAAHLSGCAGDILMTWAVYTTPGCTYVRDTATGIELLASDGGDGRREMR